ncbi:MAG: AgmX/PglI C-terminal domain-containing protein [Deltaproteobacteria bacterium]|nr:AgmX/PglI C-terminal domain-containing protein [Deltaproteobacteria bacterium]
MSQHDREGEDQSFGRRSDDKSGAPTAVHGRMELPDVEKDDAGIPTFVFRDSPKGTDRPSQERRTLEVSLLWREAVLTVANFSKPRTVYIGDDLKNDFRVSAEGLGSPRFPLITAEKGEFAINWTDTMTIEVRDGDGRISDRDALEKASKISSTHVDGGRRNSYKLGLYDKAAVQMGEVTFVIQYRAPVRVAESPVLKTMDFYFTKVMTLSLMAHLFFLLALWLTPIDPFGLSEDLFKNPNRFAKLVLKEPEKAKKKEKKFEVKQKEVDTSVKKFKAEKSKIVVAKGSPRIDPNKRENDRKKVLDTAIFKALGGGGGMGNTVANVFGPGGLGTGINNALQGLRGAEMNDAGGAGGMGMRGGGAGGAGSLGIGGLGDGSGGYGGRGGMAADLGGRDRKGYKVEIGRTITKGCLTEQQVGRVLSRVHNQARYCYEKELTRNPNMAGKVTTFFIIGSTGAVQTVKVSASTMNDAAVEDCLVRVIQRLRFPPCQGGGIAEVTYPWIFKAGGT